MISIMVITMLIMIDIETIDTQLYLGIILNKPLIIISDSA